MARGKFEERVGKTLGPQFKYEAARLSYTKPHVYIPDWIDETTKTIIEAKGLFSSADRTKMKLIKAAYPAYKIVIYLQTPNTRLSKTSKTTYSQWCDKHGFEWRRLEKP
jgi:hypothetical protein